MTNDQDANPEEEVDISFKPIVELKPVTVNTLEGEEEELFKMRAKLFRFEDEDGGEWKERGIGEMRMLKHKKSSQIRLVMRRDKVLKICCNHFMTKEMKLKPHASSDRAFLWTTLADLTDEEPKQELLAIRFRDAENAKQFQTKFEDLQKALPEGNEEDKDQGSHEKIKSESTETENVADKLDKLTVCDTPGSS